MTISDLCAALNERQPVKPSHAAKVCEECGSDDLTWADELQQRGSPNGTGYVALSCAECGELVPDDGTTETRRWVGL